MCSYAYVLIAGGVLAWFWPFIRAHRNTSPAVVVDRRGRWGILLQFVSYALLWQGPFWSRSLPVWRALVSILLFTAAATLSWTSSRALAGQLRIDAALGADHSLVRSGPYRLVRNPIYTSMLLVLSATAILIASWPRFAGSLLLFVLGTEIRVRAEEKLLERRFGEEFLAYKRSVPAYLPFL